METLKPLITVRYGVLLALLTLVYGFGLGITFGVAEDNIKGHLKAEAQAVFETTYSADAAKMKKVTDKSWVYFKRAHLHANGLGTSALAMILLLGLLPTCPRLKSVTAILLGAGGLGYAMFWMFAGLRAPGLGSTGLAKESLKWLAMPTSFFCVIGLLIVVVLVIKHLILSGGTKLDAAADAESADA